MNNRILLHSGKLVDPFDLQPDEISVFDIAHGLANSQRYCGQAGENISTAEHSVRLSRAVPEHLACVALLHDAAETYGLGDTASPVKRQIPQLVEAEVSILEPIFAKFQLSFDDYHDLKEFDTAIADDEMRFAMNGVEEFFDYRRGVIVPPSFTPGPGLGVEFEGWTKWRAQQEFINRFVELFGREALA